MVYHSNVIMTPLKSGANPDIKADYSSTEGVFEFAATEALQINKIIFRMKCASALGAGFGSGAVLGTTLALAKEDAVGGVLLDLTYGLSIIDNDDLLLLVDNDGAMNPNNFIGSAYYSIKTGAIKLVKGEKIVARLNDDMTSRVDLFNIIVDGIYLA